MANDVLKFRAETTKILDTVERSIANVFGDLLKSLRNPNFRYAVKIKKIEVQRDSARTERDDALFKRNRTREANARLIQENDQLRRENAELQAEVKILRKQRSDQAEWAQAVKDVRRR